jgi:hypothetical protein
MTCNRHKRLANENYEEEASYTTHSFSRHGVSKAIKAAGRKRNRAAKKLDARWDFDNQESD